MENRLEVTIDKREVFEGDWELVFAALRGKGYTVSENKELSFQVSWGRPFSHIEEKTIATAAELNAIATRKPTVRSQALCVVEWIVGYCKLQAAEGELGFTMAKSLIPEWKRDWDIVYDILREKGYIVKDKSESFQIDWTSNAAEK
jgi:hypothetical protein